MDKHIEYKKRLCDEAHNPEWDDIVVSAERLGDSERAYLREHPPGLVKALWSHFERTRDKCGCSSSSHEQPDCLVHFVERLLLDEESL